MPIEIRKSPYAADVKAKLANDGKVDTEEAKQLTRGWGVQPVNEQQVRAIRAAVASNESKFDRGARKVMNDFVHRRLPKLAVGDLEQALGQPGHNAILQWDPPTARSDGTPLTDLAGYKVLYGKAPGTYDQTLTVNDPASTKMAVTDLASGTYYFVVKAFDTAGNESGPSNEAVKTIR
jgi:hypothetical protein